MQPTEEIKQQQSTAWRMSWIIECSYWHQVVTLNDNSTSLVPFIWKSADTFFLNHFQSVILKNRSHNFCFFLCSLRLGIQKVSPIYLMVLLSIVHANLCTRSVQSISHSMQFHNLENEVNKMFLFISILEIISYGLVPIFIFAILIPLNSYSVFY